MAAPIKPQKVTANGKDTWFAVPAIADVTAPEATEINAISGLNFTCFLMAEQEGVTGTTEKVQLARLLCETSTTEALGDTTWTLADIQGVFDPQAAANADGKKAWNLFKDGFSGYFVRRQGVKSDTATPEAVDGQFVDVFRVETGPATATKSSTDASGIYTFTAAVALLDSPAFNVEVGGGS